MKKIAGMIFACLGFVLAVSPHAQIAVLETAARPDKEIAAIDFVCAGAQCAPFLIAITVE